MGTKNIFLSLLLLWLTLSLSTLLPAQHINDNHWHTRHHDFDRGHPTEAPPPKAHYSSGIQLNNDTIHAVLFDGTGTSLENRHIALTLAGIVNRDAPRLYLLNVYETWSYPYTDETWRDIYQDAGATSFTVISDIHELVEHFADDINGAITYDPSLNYGNFEGQNFRWQAEVAAMLGGLTDCIPLPYTNTSMDIPRPDSVAVPDPFHGQDTLWVAAELELTEHPWSDAALSQEERYFLILDWALENLLPRTNPRKFYLREITDWAVSQRMFQLNLAGTETLNFYSLSDEKAEKIEQVMTYMHDNHPDEIFHVYGWMRPEPLVQWISGWGGSFHETLLANLSWHHTFPADESFTYERPSSTSSEEVELENKHYVVFIGSEGDAGNWNAGFQAGAWLSQARGEVPVGWGFNLHFFKTFPFMGQYYYASATPNDGFLSVTHPLGYAYSDMFPENFLPDALERSAWKVQQYDVPSVYAYKHYNGAGVSTYRGVEISNNYDFNKLGAFAEQAGIDLTFLFDPHLATQQYYQQYGGLLFNHVNDNTFYSNVVDLEDAAQRIINKVSNKPRPSFLLAGYQRLRADGTAIGGGNPADITLPRLKTLMEKVQSDEEAGDNVKFVTPEQFTVLLQKKLETLSTPGYNAPTASHFTVHSPHRGELLINLETEAHEDMHIRLFNTSGQQVKEIRKAVTRGSNTLSIAIPHLGDGVYIIQLSGRHTVASQKFVYGYGSMR